ncbi:hypothetical protein PIB30_097254 [Stylosanthes scabra]|uniref:Uncharacterized protein n=1 Tax=Stylosanthes scabra TaxID=79078 RepID=A0ABU6VUM5_9FABA|nr:hypothetical protein [Stylosanthes scabra]
MELMTTIERFEDPLESKTTLRQEHKVRKVEDVLEKIEEGKLADQETEFGSKNRAGFHAYAWRSTHMRAAQNPDPRLSKHTTLRRGNLLDQIHAYAWIVTQLTSTITLPQP